jgi:hypothetical protein
MHTGTQPAAKIMIKQTATFQCDLGYSAAATFDYSVELVVALVTYKQQMSAVVTAKLFILIKF